MPWNLYQNSFLLASGFPNLDPCVIGQYFHTTWIHANVHYSLKHITACSYEENVSKC